MRLSDWLVLNELARDKKHAEGLILSANVLINDTPVTSAAYIVKNSDAVRVRNQRKWVARSAEKLDYALRFFHCHVRGKICLDVGSSTGGFTQVLLEHGASRVIALDVAYGFLHPLLRKNEAVRVMERTHICNVTRDDFPEKPDFFVVDVSFISIQKVCLCLKKLYNTWEGIVLFKPQFEVTREDLDHGVLVNSQILDESLKTFKHFLEDHQISIKKEVISPILGKKGNREFLFYIEWSA